MSFRVVGAASLLLFAGCFSAQSIEEGKFSCAAQTDCLNGFVCFEGACCKQERVTGLCEDHPCVKEGTDTDNDGFPVCAGDCDDNDVARFPGGNEACDGKDNNCNNVVDENAGVTRYRDLDGDGHGSNKPEDQLILCAAEANKPNVATDQIDCDDTNPKRFGGNPEACDGIDNDCNQQIDDGQTTLFFQDLDGDRFGNNLFTIQACAAPPGYAAVGGDCQDNSPNIRPGVAEQCNGLDDNCNGLTDEGVTQSFYPDVDGDGYGRGDGGFVQGCAPPTNFAANAQDCDDNVDTINPASAEVCNGRDDNCVGGVDEGVRPLWYKDADGDLYGTVDVAGRVQACSAPDASFIVRSGDCFDFDAGTSPAAPETCNGRDDNCNGLADEGVTRSFWRDQDGDQYGDPTGPVIAACSASAGQAANSSDCDDTAANRYPGAPETCDGLDNNCDGIKDNNTRCGPRADFAEDPANWNAQTGNGTLSAAQSTAVGCLANSPYVVDTQHRADTGKVSSGAASIRAEGTNVDYFLYAPATRNANWDLNSQRLRFQVAGANTGGTGWEAAYRQPLLFFCGSNGTWARAEPTATTLTDTLTTVTFNIPPNTTPGNGYTYNGGTPLFNWSRVDWIEVHVNSAGAGSSTLWVDDFHFVSQ